MPVKLAWTTEQIEEIRRRNLAGESTSSIAKQLGISEPTIRKLYKELGLTSLCRKDPQITPDDYPEVRRLYAEEGLGLKQIAKRFGAKSYTVLYHMKKMGLARRSKPAAKMTLVEAHQAMRIVDCGTRIKDAARIFGVSVPVARRWIIKARGDDDC